MEPGGWEHNLGNHPLTYSRQFQHQASGTNKSLETININLRTYTLFSYEGSNHFHQEGNLGQRIWHHILKSIIYFSWIIHRNLYAGQEATVRTWHGITDWFQIGEGVHQAVYCHPTYLTYMQSTSCEIPGLMKHKLESRLLGEISKTSNMQIIPLK